MYRPKMGRHPDRLAETERWLLIFDARPGRSWKQRLWQAEVAEGGRTVHLRGA